MSDHAPTTQLNNIINIIKASYEQDCQIEPKTNSNNEKGYRINFKFHRNNKVLV